MLNYPKLGVNRVCAPYSVGLNIILHMHIFKHFNFKVFFVNTVPDPDCHLSPRDARHGDSKHGDFRTFYSSNRECAKKKNTKEKGGKKVKAMAFQLAR